VQLHDLAPGTCDTSEEVAKFFYDADGKRVKSSLGSEPTLFIGPHFEVANPGVGQTVTKYYFADAQSIAVRKYVIPSTMSVEYLLGDHLGSTSLTTDKDGVKVSEIRYSWTSGVAATPAYKLSSYFTILPRKTGPTPGVQAAHRLLGQVSLKRASSLTKL
jgi:hypothetical protein